MKAHNFDLHQYLARIGFEGQAQADIHTVRNMMRCQLFTVPFENLDVLAGKVVSLVPEDIVDKIVTRKRGGYCYEVNGLFAMALDALGIAYQFVAARPMFYPVRRPKTHMALVLTLDNEQWLCDLGFGSYGIRAPIALTCLNQDIAQDSDLFRLTGDEHGNFRVQAWCDSTWANQYEFNLSPQEWIDFSPANYLNSTHPDAVFVQKLLIVLHNPSGRKILFGPVLKTIENGVSRQDVLSAQQTASVLLHEFGLMDQ